LSLIRRVFHLFSRARMQRDIDAEVKSHIEMRIADNIAAGLADEEARRVALLRFGNPEVIKERVAGVNSVLILEDLWRDAGYAFRQLRKAPGFAIAVIATLALGIGANTAIFSVVSAVLLRPLPYKNPSRLVVVWQTDAAHRETGAWFDAYREFEEWQRGSKSFEKLAALTWGTSGQTLLWRDKPIGLLAIPASADFFAMLGAQAQIGRTFHQSDLQNACTLVLAYPFWRDKLGAPGNIAGESVVVDRSSCIVVGVMPKDFIFYPKETNAWSLITPTGAFAKTPWESMTGVFGLLKPGVTRSQAEAELNAIQQRTLPGAPAALSLLTSATPIVLDLQDNFTWLAGRDLRSGLWVLSGAVGLILLMTCLNVANLLLSRISERSREMAVRTALGSGRARLMRQMLTESLMLVLCGTGVGVALATSMIQWFRKTNPVELPPGNVVSLDWHVLLFAALLGVGSAITIGSIPAWRASGVDPNFMLNGGDRSIGRNASAPRTSSILVVVQMALSLMLIVGAGLLAASLWNMASTRLGYRTDRVLTARINLPKEHYGDADARSRFAAELAGKISVLSGVEAVTVASNFTPMGENPLSVEGDARFSPGGIATQSVSSGFFGAMQIPMFRGRVFDTQDGKETQQVAVVNEALANRYFPHTDPIGRAIKLSRADDSSQPWLRIIGVVADIKTTTVFQEMGYVEQPAVYRPLNQDPPDSLSLMVLTKESALGLVGGIEQQLASMDHDLPLTSVATMKDQQSAVLSQPRFRTLLFGSFAVLALVLAIVGLYGVLAQLVARRTREIAVRMALGASRRVVLIGVIREAVILAAAGIVLGVSGSVAGVRVLTRLLYQVRAENAPMFALAAGILMLTALIASLTPAWRAASVDPMRALRGE
jgi:predicted permease